MKRAKLTPKAQKTAADLVNAFNVTIRMSAIRNATKDGRKFATARDVADAYSDLIDEVYEEHNAKS